MNEQSALDLATITLEQFAKTIDHSLLQPQLTYAEVKAGCELAARYHVASVCVKPCDVGRGVEALAGSDVLVGTVIGFPHGSATTVTKTLEAKQALDEGAVELDMVINYGSLRSGDLEYVGNEVKIICLLAHQYRPSAKVKVIFENAYLTDEQKIAACKLCDEAGADWVKTSTGFAPTGATIADIKLMRANVSPRVQIKAAHGVRTLATALEMIEAGVTRIGATATATMCDDFVKWRAGEMKIEGREPSGGY
ncbi:MAG: deoxyribose-phosphate aldolase [Acidobacteriota bacterium]